MGGEQGRLRISIMHDLISALERIARERLENWPSEWQRYHWAGYTYDHTLRVRNLAVSMAQQEGADAAVVEVAALLHDIAKPAGDDHGAAGAEEAERILRVHGVAEDLRKAVCSAIETHTGKNTPEHPIENLVLGDADLIDANFGLVASWRFITIRAGHETPLDETIERMEEWLPRKDALMENLLTSTGLRIARARSDRMHRFYVDLRASAARDATAAKDGYSLVAAARHMAESYTSGRLKPQVEEIGSAVGDELGEATLAVQRLCRDLRAEIAGRI